jgi:RNA polymerase sigma factor (sigma-70 family)
MGEMREKTDIELLRDYAERGHEAAFRELVTRYTDLVYSAALRQLESADLASDITQGVFLDLARKARPVSERLAAHHSLAGWLHRSTRYAVLNHLRDTRRRVANERLAMEQLLNNSEASVDWEQIRPALDEALDSLGDEDREALLLRYFKNHDLRTVGATLGVSDDAAQKRVSRAVERMREFFAKRGVSIGAGGLVAVVTANAVQAAPAGLAVTISTAAALSGTTIATTATATATKAIAMTTLQKTVVTATVAVLAGAGIYEAKQASQLRDQVETLLQQQAPLAEHIEQLRSEREETARQLAALRDDNERLNRNTTELLRLRGQVGVLRQELAAMKQSASQPESATNEVAKSWRVGEIKWIPQWKDLGLGSPDAAVQTYWCAVAKTNVERIKQCMVFDRVTNAIPVSDLFANREARANRGFYKGGWAARLAAVTQDSPFRGRLQIEWMAVGHPDRLPFDPADPPKWDPDRTETIEVMRNEAGGDWQVVGDEHRLMLILDDEDSEAVAKMLIQMPAEQVEQVKSLIPEQTLRVFEQLKAKSGQ